MIKNLISFGCSWSHGTDLLDPTLKEKGYKAVDAINDPYRLSHSYPGIIAQQFNWRLEDRTKYNTTLTEMLTEFKIWMAKNTEEYTAESLVIIGLTHESSIGTQTEDDVFENVVSEFDNLAATHNIRLLQFNVLARQHKLKYPTLIESSSALEMLVIRDKPRKDPLFSEYKFPNEKGHLIISEFLINKIECVILNE